MTFDWFVLLTPIFVLIVVAPLLFVGCGRFEAAETPGTVPGTTTFLLEMDPNLQEGLNSPVVRIEVTWSLESSSGAAIVPLTVPQPPAQITSRQQPPPDPPAIDPVKDRGAVGAIPTTSLASRDRVRCAGRVFLANGNTPNVVAGTNNPAVLGKDAVHEFRIKSRRPQQGGFEVYFNGA